MGFFDFFRRKKGEPSTPVFRERRLVPRWRINSRAQIRWEGLSDYVPCEIKNLSLKGCAITLSQAIPEGCTRITLYFRSEYIFHLEVAIVWYTHEKNTHGLKFTSIKDSDQEKIQKMVREDFPDQLEAR